MNGAKFSWEANAFLLLKVKKQKNLQTEINYSDLPNIGKVFYLDFFFFFCLYIYRMENLKKN